jgi:hypothetical protein
VSDDEHVRIPAALYDVLKPWLENPMLLSNLIGLLAMYRRLAMLTTTDRAHAERIGVRLQGHLIEIDAEITAAEKAQG